jgi:hypothetical protein
LLLFAPDIGADSIHMSTGNSRTLGRSSTKKQVSSKQFFNIYCIRILYVKKMLWKLDE